MKKQFLRFLSAASAAATMCACTGLHASAEVADRIMGDLDGDCRVTLYDCLAAAELCSNSLLGLTGDETNESNYPADIDMNGKITLSDIMAMNEYYTLSLLGENPLWADLREVSYSDGSEHMDYSVDGTLVPSILPFTLTGMYLEVGCASGKPGEEVTVPVYVAAADNLSGFQYRQSVSAGYTVTNVTAAVADEDDFVYWIPKTHDRDDANCLLWIYSDYDQHTTSMDVSDGVIVANYTYKIPEDAQSGDTCIIKPDTAYSVFNMCTVNGEKLDVNCYQYTAVDGVIFVE